MPIINWFIANKKQLITHSAIIISVVIFSVFVIEPLFDRFERIPGEAEVYKYHLTAETNNIIYNCESFVATGKTSIQMRGWAFINNLNSDNNEVYIVLRSPAKTYIFSTQTMVREDVTQHFNRLNLNLDNSGFNVIIPLRKIDYGEYIVGIFIKKGTIEALQFIDKTIIKSKTDVKIVP